MIDDFIAYIATFLCIATFFLQRTISINPFGRKQRSETPAFWTTGPLRFINKFLTLNVVF